MRSERTSVLGKHFFRIAVIRRNKCSATVLQHTFHHTTDALVHGSDSLFRCGNNACVPHHIAVGVVENHHIVLALFNFHNGTLAHFVSAHFRLQIVGGNLGGSNKHTAFVFVGGFHSAVEEESYVSVLFRFGNTQLCFAQFGKIFAQSVFVRFRFEGNVHPFKLFIVLSHASPMHFASLSVKVKSRKTALSEGTCHFTSPVGTEVEEYHGVAVFHRCNGFAVLGDYGRQHEFVRYTFGVTCIECLNGVGCSAFANAQSKHVVGLFHTVPTVVSVHGVVSAAHGCDFAELQLLHVVTQLLYKACTACGRNVTSVHKTVNVHVVQSLTFGKIHQSHNVVDVRVNAATAQKSHKVKFAVVFACVFRSSQKCGIFEKVSVLDGLGDACQFLIDHTTCAYVEVSHFAVAHLSFGQANGKTACIQLRCGIVLHQVMHIGRTFHAYCVAQFFFGQTVSVHNNECGYFLIHKNFLYL